MKRRNLIVGVGALASAGASSIAYRRSTGSMSDYDDYVKSVRAKLVSEPAIQDLIRYATLAANGHNTQPWRFVVSKNAIRLRPDETRRTSVVDPDDHHLIVSLGCAMENLAIAARAAGKPGEVVVDHDGTLTLTLTNGAAHTDPLLAAIPLRQSTRTEFDGRAIPTEDLATLERASAEPGVRMILLTDRERIDAVRDLVAAGSDTQMADPAFVAELRCWIRFNPRSAMRSGDGLFSAASGNPSLPTMLGNWAFSALVTGESERAKYARHIDSSPALAVFVGDRADKLHWAKVGRSCQRFCLTATRRGLKVAFVNQPVEIAELRPALASLIGETGKRPDLVVRLGYGPALPYSPRRRVADVLTFE
jgi:nitroreductase